jgi:hypothetical protein
MQYMLLMVAEPDDAADEVQAQAQQAVRADETDEPCWLPWSREVTARGVVIKDGARLRPASTATTLGARDGEILLSDGPFAETKEQIVGYNVIECADLDEAVETASRHPVVTRSGGRVEIRPILPD